MSETNGTTEYQAIADGLNALALGRIASATSVEVLSTRGDKLLQVVEEADDSKVVTRSFTRHAIAQSEWYGLNFKQAWQNMHDVFTGDGVGVVRSSLLTSSGEYPYIAVSEYVTEDMSLRDASTELKVKLARHMGGWLKPTAEQRPALEMLNEHMFTVVEDEDGSQTALLLDVDPHTLHQTTGRSAGARDMLNAHYIDTLGNLFWRKWCKEDEREEVLRALVATVGDAVLDDLSTASSKTFTAFSKIHFMSQGFGPEEFMGVLA